jgi:hypothetical protein
MTKVVGMMSMSLDGYVADAKDGLTEVFDWYFLVGRHRGLHRERHSGQDVPRRLGAKRRLPEAHDG